MLKLKWFVICRRVTTDQPTGLFSLLDCVEGMRLGITLDKAKESGFPLAVQADVSLAMNWKRELTDDPKFTFRLTCRMPSGELFFQEELEGEFDLADQHSVTHKTVVKMSAVQVDAPGELTFEVDVKEGDEWKLYGCQTLAVWFKDS
ncbi:DUF6941 family protein [Elongatibacter sediminis]|uniref:Uncharacterized protein n=1 Tax=Elongatibacter sediminis TaxID=3119006 RepID=A0AAW9RIR9_9GAMM